MNKYIKLAILSFLLVIPAYAQMGGGGMMGRGMMGGGMSGNQGYLNRSRGPEGAEIYDMFCSNCHVLGGNVIINALPLRGAPQLSDFNTFLEFIRDPRMPNGSPGLMPSFPPDRISDAQAQKLYSYLVDWLGSPQPLPGKETLNKDQARQQVESYLKSTGNPNLKVGKIEDKGEVFQVEVVTKNGSLVDKILVNKRGGGMRSIYH